MVESRDSGNRTITGTAIVNASVAELHQIIANPNNHGALDGSGMVGDVIRGGGPMQVGTPFTIQMKAFGLIPYKITSVPTQVNDHTIEWQSGPSKVRWRWEFEPLGPDETRVTETWDTSHSSIPLLRALLGRPTAKGIEQSLKNLQARYVRVT